MAACSLCCSAALAAPAAPDTAVPHGKLPRWAIPQSYQLALRIDPEQADFTGITRIKVQLKQASDFLWIHGKELKVSKVTVTTADGKTLPAKYVEADAQAGVARVEFGAELQPQTLALSFNYEAPLNQHLEGLYQVKYQGKAYAMTQMEPVSARYAFPGFDEPDFKTPYTLQLTVPKGEQALANTKVIRSSDDGDGWKTVQFAPTLPLPTYLVAYGVGPWDVVDGGTIPANAWRKTPLPFGGVAAEGQGPRLKRPLAQTPEIIEALEDYYGFGYPFDKLDIVAAPDFSAGAMENPGFVTFRDWYLLLDDNSPARNVQGSFEVEAHELAHQWTGDTVTMAWWDDLWLNESFATWMQQKVTMKLHPEYRADLDRIRGAQRAMGNDSLVSARKMRQPITGNGDIENAFDGITYQKGAAVLGMFEGFVGEQTFQKGMRHYIQAHKFGNATADDLVDAIADAAGKGAEFKAAFNSFLNQSGVPYVQARLAQKGGKTVLEVHQQRYLPLGSSGDADRTWGIPLCVKYGTPAGIKSACQLISKADGEIVLKGATADSWVLPNANGAGYYRFGLPKAQFAALGQHVAELSDGEQLAYADAVDAAFDRGDADAATVLEAMQELSGSSVPDVATAMLGSFEWVWQHEATTEAQRDALRAAAEKAYLPRLQALGYQRKDGESSDDVRLRSALASLLGYTLKVPQVRQALLAQGEAVLKGDGQGHLDFKAANPDLLGTVLAVAVEEQGQPAVDKLIAELKTNGEPSQRNAMISGIGATTDPKALTEVRDFALGDNIKVGEMFSVLMGGHAHPQTHASMWPWFTEHFDAIVKRTGAFTGGRLPMLGAAGSCSDEEADRTEAFFKPRLKDLPGADRGLAQTTESIRLCSALKAKQDPAAITE